MRQSILILATFTSLMFAGTMATAALDTAVPAPIEFLQTLDSRVQKIVRAASSDSLSSRDNARVRGIISEAFDFKEMSRLALGEHWDARSDKERADFVSLYRKITELSNFDIFVQYYRQGDIDYIDASVDAQGCAVVQALVPMKRETKSISYALRRPDGTHWRIYDLTIDGASIVAGNRRLYGRYITKYSFEKLMERLHKKLTRLQDTP